MKNRIFSLTAVCLILTMLILAEPVKGFTLDLTVDKTLPLSGDLITFIATVNIPSGEQFPIEYLILNLNGPNGSSCKFDVGGAVISGCNGMTITLSSSSSYGYGYNYGYSNSGNYRSYGYGYQSGTLTYVIRMNTGGYAIGDYTTALDVRTGSDFTQEGPSFRINKRPRGGSCRTVWECSDWGACVDGEQTRTCEKVVKRCLSDDEPELTKVCPSNLDAISPDILRLKTAEKIPEVPQNRTNETTRNFISGITGAVTGAFGEMGSAGIIFFALIVGIVAVLIAIVRKFY